MCGIVGIYYKVAGRAIDTALLTKMCDAIYHRGPDDDGYFLGGRMGMGMGRR